MPTVRSGRRATMDDEPSTCCIRVAEGGELLERLPLDQFCFSCALGGDDGRTLFLVVADWNGPDAVGSGRRPAGSSPPGRRRRPPDLTEVGPPRRWPSPTLMRAAHVDVRIPPDGVTPRRHTGRMYADVERCLRAVLSRDSRFDGQFVTAVVTTGIYCRPSCPVHPPKAENMRFMPNAAAAQAAGYPGVQAVPAGCRTRIARVGPAVRRRGPLRAADRRRCGRSRGRRRPRLPTRIQPPAAPTPDGRRPGGRPESPWPVPNGPSRHGSCWRPRRCR